ARLQSVIRKAMESGVPDWIIIDERKLNEHVPFHILPEKDGPAVAARHLRQWLRELPFPADRIWVTKRLSKLAPDNFVGAERMWFFGDRHWQDTPRAQAEIAAFVRRIELCAHEQALEHALESGEFDEFDEPVDAPPSGEQPSPSVPWDGDDGIDEIDRIDP